MRRGQKKTLVGVLVGALLALPALLGRKRAPKARQGGPSALPFGYRRAREDEVTDEMRAAAVGALRLPSPLGTFTRGPGFGVLIELHRDERRGPHKGASVLLPIEGGAA